MVFKNLGAFVEKMFAVLVLKKRTPILEVRCQVFWKTAEFSALKFKVFIWIQAVAFDCIAIHFNKYYCHKDFSGICAFQLRYFIYFRNFRTSYFPYFLRPTQLSTPPNPAPLPFWLLLLQHSTPKLSVLLPPMCMLPPMHFQSWHY